MAVLAILLNVVDRLGLLGRIETFLQESGFGSGFKVDLAVVLRGGAGIGLGLVLVAVIATMLLGFFFNGLSGMLGGLVVSVLEERPPLPRPLPSVSPEVAPNTDALPAAPSPANVPDELANAQVNGQVNGWEDDRTMWDAPTPSPAGTASGSTA